MRSSCSRLSCLATFSSESSLAKALCRNTSNGVFESASRSICCSDAEYVGGTSPADLALSCCCNIKIVFIS